MSVYKIVLLSGLVFFSCKNEGKKVDGTKATTQTEQKVLKVDGIITREEITTETISTTGTIVANEEVEIKSEISGKITGIYFKEGTFIKVGQLLVKLNDDDLQAQVRKLNIEIKMAEEKEGRMKQLLAATAISKEEYDVQLTSLNLLKANVDIIKVDISKTRITAPFSGIIGFKNVSPGAIISSSTVIASIQNTQPLKLEFSIPEKYNNLIYQGITVDFKVTGSNIINKANVYAKEPKIDQNTRTSKVRAIFSNPGGKLFPGSFAEINISIGEKRKVKMVPTIAYIPDIAGAKLFVKRGGVAVSVPVKAGIRTEKEIQILEGLNDGDTVIVSGMLQLKPKMPVEVNIINQAQ
ncbi:MAG: efflux RND transporter periplasmic adaptor subunit [Saprospiraceae bacterium]|nr:efflux RND transporter periplasmic adaptor subunit [Saprospiraceae bacterium]